GEEFSILLPEANAANAIRTANRLRKEIAEVPFAFEGQLLRVTVSIGVATLAAGEDLPSLMQRADRALYRAKEAGRDEVIASAA
ncbi:MAG: diguanylate cyclase, partial [Hoeflea sp.]|nr:diguanylate cyclase [Hoeflea sp.]